MFVDDYSGRSRGGSQGAMKPQKLACKTRTQNNIPKLQQSLSAYHNMFEIFSFRTLGLQLVQLAHEQTFPTLKQFPSLQSLKLEL